uniref:Bms1-type G domain-containing protein n=1 Tax=Tetradesmus obliquus TaxID=3088 RepID=A0A383VWG4_TETOB|eukprot:jgi/Sobl393_1/3125/SZX69189.1
MGGPSAHGQRNKGHKAGKHAGKSARDKHKLKKEGGSGPRTSIKSASHSNKLERAQASKQHRDAKRNELLEARRRHSAPVVVAILPLSADVNPAPLLAGLLAAAGSPGTTAAAADGSLCTILAQGRRRVRLTLLPAPLDRDDPLAIVDLAKAAEVLLLLLPGQEGAVSVDAAGSSCLTVLRAMGLPSTIAVVLNQQQQHGSTAAVTVTADAMGIDGEDDAAATGGAAASAKGSSADLKRRSAAKKRAEKALQQHLPGDTKLVAGDNTQDMQQLLRTVADSMPQLPVWRRQRPYVMVQQASFQLNGQQQQQDDQQQQQLGQLRLTGYVRAQGLSANQLITVPGAGDFRILRIEGPPDPAAAIAQPPPQQRQHKKGGAMDMDMQDVAGAAAAAGAVLALPDPEQQEALVRENEPDPLDGEQTWPTEEELAAAAGGSKLRKRRLPAGTSEYQAAWILDDDEVSGSDDNDDEEEDDDAAMAEDAAAAGGAPSAVPLSEDLASEEDYGAAAGDEGDDDASMMGDDEEAEQAAAQRLREELKAKRMAEAEDAEYPDEIDTPQDMPARQRFAKYRGLKSFRSSPWDAREGLPAEYGRVFAFENFKRTAKRAHEAVARATDGSDPCCVLPGSWVTLVLADVPAAAAAAVLERTAAAAAAAAACAAAAAGDDGMSLDAGVTSATGAVPLTVYGLLQHEAKLSVVNFSMKKAASYTETIRNKEELLLVCGLRSFTGQPVLSDDAQGADKNKMERFLHPGKTAVGSLYAPISFPPLPLLAFKVVPGQKPQLAATGALRSCDPDRLVVKKIVLSGYPVRVHKTRGVVRLMFFNPDDIRWFKPVELWTKSGRRGRITEPLGTHGAFKARFDGPVQQRDAVCMSLYKRVFPKWPAAAQQQGGLGMASFA